MSQLCRRPYHALRFILVVAVLCATCQAQTAIRWTTITGVTTAFTPPATCTSSTYLSDSKAFEVAPAVIYKKAFCLDDASCCPDNYPLPPRDALGSVEAVFAPGVCPSGYIGQEYETQGELEKIQYCCPRSWAMLPLGNRNYCVTSTAVQPSLTPDPSTTNEPIVQIIIANPIYIIAPTDLSPALATASTTPTGDPNEIKNPQSHDAGLKIGIALAVSVPTIAVLAFISKVFICRSKKEVCDRDGGEDGRRPVAAPTYELSRVGSGRQPCDDDDSVMSEPLPPYRPRSRDGVQGGGPTEGANNGGRDMVGLRDWSENDTPAPDYGIQSPASAHVRSE